MVFCDSIIHLKQYLGIHYHMCLSFQIIIYFITQVKHIQLFSKEKFFLSTIIFKL